MLQPELVTVNKSVAHVERGPVRSVSVVYCRGLTGSRQAAETGDAPGLAARGAGAASGALARLPEAAALRFLRQMRPGAAEAALSCLQARTPAHFVDVCRAGVS